MHAPPDRRTRPVSSVPWLYGRLTSASQGCRLGPPKTSARP